MKKALFLWFFLRSIDHLFDNLESGKKLLFWKKSGKSLEFWIQKFVRTLDIGKIEAACVRGAKRGGEGVGKSEKSAKGEGR